VIDRRRISMFDSLGGFVRTTPIPGLFQAIAPVDSFIVRTFTTAFYPGGRPDNPPVQWTRIRISDNKVERMDFRHPGELGLAAIGTGNATGWGARSPDGDYWFDLGGGRSAARQHQTRAGAILCDR
jgi:hypothetical protein